MLPIGRIVSLEVRRSLPIGLILGDGSPGDAGEVLLPKRYVPAGASPGDVLEVFLYTDSEDRPIATTEVPLARVDEFASLRVVETNRTGAFLDWGLPKDLLLPFRNQLQPLHAGKQVVVRVYFDEVSERPVATAKLERFLDLPPDDLRAGQSVQLLVYETTALGSKAIVDGSYGGLLHRRPDAPEPEIGASLPGYVQRVRADGKIDLALTPTGAAGLDHAQQTLLDALRRAGGRLELGDGSDPDEIRRQLGLSKKAFKRAAGGLYRDRRVRLDDASIELNDAGAVAAPKPTGRG